MLFAITLGTQKAFQQLRCSPYLSRSLVFNYLLLLILHFSNQLDLGVGFHLLHLLTLGRIMLWKTYLGKSFMIQVYLSFLTHFLLYFAILPSTTYYCNSRYWLWILSILFRVSFSTFRLLLTKYTHGKQRLFHKALQAPPGCLGGSLHFA